MNYSAHQNYKNVLIEMSEIGCRALGYHKTHHFHYFYFMVETTPVYNFVNYQDLVKRSEEEKREFINRSTVNSKKKLPQNPNDKKRCFTPWKIENSLTRNSTFKPKMVPENL